MKTEFTPGPWVASHVEFNGSADKPALTDPGYYEVTSPLLKKMQGPIVDTCNADTGRTPEEHRANVLLIAAAPDMYASLNVALRELTELSKEIGGCDHSVGICTCSLKWAIESVSAALAKARGEQ